MSAHPLGRRFGHARKHRRDVVVAYAGNADNPALSGLTLSITAGETALSSAAPAAARAR